MQFMLSRYLGKGVRILKQAEDQGLFALYKPAGVVSHLDFGVAKTSSSKPKSAFVNSLIDSSCRYDPAEELFHTPDGPVHLLHRLDKDTSGIVLVATDIKVAKSVRTAFRTRTVSKTYQSLSFGQAATLGSVLPPVRWEDQYIPPEYKADRPRVFPRGTFPQTPAESSSSSSTSSDSGRDSGKSKASTLIPGSKMAITSVLSAEQRWISLSTVGKARPGEGEGESPAAASAERIPATLLTLRPSTGFMHQLRVVLAARGFPIVGDQLYGNFAIYKLLQRSNGSAGKAAKQRMFLHAREIELSYLLDGKMLTFAATTEMPTVDGDNHSSSSSSSSNSSRKSLQTMCSWEADLRGLLDDAV